MERAKAPQSLAIPSDRADLAQNQELVARMRRSIFAYYRYIDAPFTERVCDEWSTSIDDQPLVNLHGDAHLEQYAVADDGRGLADFDTASIGPPVVDLLRFSTSLWLAARGRFTDEDVDKAVTRFLEGYRATLTDPTVGGPEPRAAARIRAGFGTSPVEWLDHVEKFMLPLTDEQRAKLVRSNESYRAAILAQNPDLTAAFFTIKRAGAIKMGIGSVHEMKFLARVEGPTSLPDDDVILETKQVVGHAMGSCVHGGEWGDPIRVIMGQARLSDAPQKFLGYCELEHKTFYVHAWRVHYTELDVNAIQSGDELAELAFDVGLQLGRGHPKQLADGPALRKKLLEYVAREEPSLHLAAAALSKETVVAWQAFQGPTPP